MPAANDPFGPFAGAPDGPYIHGFTVTESDTVDFPQVCNALWVATAQTELSVVMQSGATVAFVAVPAGTMLRIRARRVNATGTTPGTGIVALV